MTRYEQGFMNKCAEHGISCDIALRLMKSAAAATAVAQNQGLQSHIGQAVNNLANRPWYHPLAVPARGVRWFRNRVAPVLNGQGRAVQSAQQGR